MTRRRGGGPAIALAMAVALLAGCSSMLGPRVTVQNEMTVPLTVDANGHWIGTVGPGASATLGFALGDGQTSIMARTPSGAVVADLLETNAMIEDAMAGTGVMAAWQDVACGRVLLALEPFDGSGVPPAPEGVAGAECP